MANASALNPEATP